MAYERTPRDRTAGDYDARPNSNDYGRDVRPTGDADRRYSSARDYDAAGAFDRESGRDSGRPRRGPDPGSQSGRAYYGNRPQGEPHRVPQGMLGDQRNDRDSEYHGSYAHDGHRFEDVGRNRHADDDDRGRERGYGRPPQGYDHDDRGFIARAGDEVRSWFGDDEAERRREQDARWDERDERTRALHERDDHYQHWRRNQIAALDRDYEEYRQENRSKFDTEFGAWRTERQGQRSSLSRVEEHMEVVGSDGAHVGTVDKVRGDRILLTRTDKDAGGIHHSIPSRWIRMVDAKVTLAKPAADAKAAWKDEDRNAAEVDYGDRRGSRDGGRDAGTPDGDPTGGRTPDTSFTGTD